MLVSVHYDVYETRSNQADNLLESMAFGEQHMLISAVGNGVSNKVNENVGLDNRVSEAIYFSLFDRFRIDS